VSQAPRILFLNTCLMSRQAQRRVIEDYIGRIRAQLVRVLRSIEPEILRALSGYRQMAYDWAEKTVGQIQRRFEAYASGYRAQVERMVGSQELSSEQEQAVRHRLDALQEKRAKQPVQAAG
jgi:hypothetical protein